MIILILFESTSFHLFCLFTRFHSISEYDGPTSPVASCFTHWYLQAFTKYSDDKILETVDPLLEETVDAEIVVKMFELAIQCAAPVRADRPDMKLVGEQLWAIRADYISQKKDKARLP